MSLLPYLPELGSMTLAAIALAVACVSMVKAAPFRLIVAGSAAVIAAMILIPLTGHVLTRLTPRTPNIDGSLPGPVMSSVELPTWLNELARIGAGGALAIVLVTLVQVCRLRSTRRIEQTDRRPAGLMRGLNCRHSAPAGGPLRIHPIFDWGSSRSSAAPTLPSDDRTDQKDQL